ncbi:MAG: hypothetical protein H7A19_08930 [Rhodanobacteraceae bacterium]|nr:hypothetical protein [Rhodanobacteraceae bacterium]
MDDLAPETVACLDSAHWGQLLAALGSTQTRPQALVRLSAFAAQGGMLALTFHHILELAQHENTEKVKVRFEALCELGPLRVVSAITVDGPGSIVDLVALELMAALKSPDANATSVADLVWPNALATATGAQVSDWVLPQLDVLRTHLTADAARRRAVSALSQSVVLDRSKERLMPNVRLVSPHQAKANLASLEKRLTAEVVSRRDPRASESEAASSAAEFVRELTIDADAIAAHGNHWEGLLARAGVSAQDVAGMRYVSEAVDLAQFRKQVEIAAYHLGVSAEELCRVRPEQFPTWLIHRAYNAHRQLATTTRASDLGDLHLLSHAPYMDALFVDKRTHENVRRIRQKDANAGVFLQSVVRAGSWEEALVLPLSSTRPGKT